VQEICHFNRVLHDHTHIATPMQYKILLLDHLVDSCNCLSVAAGSRSVMFFF